jgi:hypothetical protein
LPTPTIGATSGTLATSYFAPAIYTGTGATQSVTVGFQPDWVWIKNRTNGANWHVLTDSVRGIQKEIYTNSTAAEATLTTTGVNQFNSSGFQILGSSGDYNRSADNYVAWNWRASNATAVSNTAGTLTSTVSANTTSGFSVVTYTGNGIGASTVGHGIGIAPSMMIIKRRSTTAAWVVYHASLGPTQGIYLNLTDAAATASTFWNNTAPSSSVLTLGTVSENNVNGSTYVAYCFAAVAGFSAFGSYTGNGSADGPFVFTGMRPAFILVKASSSSNLTNWSIFDTSRSPSNLSTQILAPNISDAEFTTVDSQIDILSNGFKLRSTTFTNGINQSGGTYIFMAFASNPFKYSLAR